MNYAKWIMLEKQRCLSILNNKVLINDTLVRAFIKISLINTNKKYIGQTGRSFQIRFREHKHDYKYMCYKSRFAQHLSEEGHSFDTIENIMEIIQYARKGRMMDALEKFHIYDITRKGVQINDRLTIQRNPIFDAVLRNRQHTGDR